MTADILERKKDRFLLWLPYRPSTSPQLVIGQFQRGNPPTLIDERILPLTPAPGESTLFELPATAAGLRDDQVYHYWFRVPDRWPGAPAGAISTITDPTALTVDWRLTRVAGRVAQAQPASVTKFRAGQLLVCDPGGDEPDLSDDPSPEGLCPNARMVIYELPTSWARALGNGPAEQEIGTFRDVRALIDERVGGANFDDLEVTQPGKAYLTELGVNALQLLPVPDASAVRLWNYGTSHYFAPDHDLGFPVGHDSPTSNTDFAALVVASHRSGIRVILDWVMGYADNEAYQQADFDNFYIDHAANHPTDPDAHTSIRGTGKTEFRQDFGGINFRFSRSIKAYRPVTGGSGTVFPARQLLLASLIRWMRDFHLDGYRLDSIENVANWDFIQEFKDTARSMFSERWQTLGFQGSGDDRFIVVGEELTLPFGLLEQNRLDGLWNEPFQQKIRSAILGEGADDFEHTIRTMIDCRSAGFLDGSQAINYITSHDVQGNRKERLFTMLTNAGVPQNQIGKRVVLAFACLLSAVGIPMILAGEEFADQHDLLDAEGQVVDDTKQADPVTYSRLFDTTSPLQPLRMGIFQSVSRLVALRTSHPALAVNDTDFIHVDFEQGKRVLVWRRGSESNPVVVVANFSDWSSDTSDPEAEYKIRNWPQSGKAWREVTKGRPVPAEWAGREPIFAWEAKVYALE